MKPIKTILGDTKPKNVEKIQKACEKGDSAHYASSFLAEATKDTAIDFPKTKCLVTENFFCSYSLFGVAFSNILTIIPINQITNLYRSNVGADGSYDYDNFHLDIELIDGQKRQVSTVVRNAKNYATIYADVISCVRSKISIMEG